MRVDPRLCLRRLLWGALLLAALPAAAGLPEVTRGSLLLHRPDGPVAAPTLATRVSIEIRAMSARVRVAQRFRNPAPDWTEAVYAFPLPDDAAVDRLRVQAGERTIEGRIEERRRAEQVYAEARETGRRAGLVTQERPNLFTTALANLGPGEEVEVRIEYQQGVEYRDGEFRLRFPLVVGPRYIAGTPRPPLEERLTLSHGWARDTDLVPDASRITPPVATPDSGVERPVTLDVRLDAGVPLERVHSSYHPVVVETRGGVSSVRLAGGPVPADRDFELVWRPAPGQTPRAALFTETTDRGRYGLLMLMPPAPSALEAVRQPRDLTLVIDTSGSMHGESMDQARAAVQLALNGLDRDDRFRLIRFADRAGALGRGPLDATPGNLAAAHAWVDGLEAEGGTEMASALELALPPGEQDATRLTQVVFVTDGAVGNEQALFGIIQARLGQRRLFTVGIGSAPNAHFMHEAARLGRGSYTFIGRQSEVAARMGALLQRLAYPPLTDLRLEAEGARIYPDPIPDLYPGEPLVVAMQLEQPLHGLLVEGRLGGRTWQARLALDGARDGRGVARLWARRRIDHLDRRLHRAQEQGERETLRAQLLETALAHGLVSAYTALVAVDTTPVRPADPMADSRAVPTLMPAGWSHSHVFGMARTATPAALNMGAGLLLLVTALVLLAASRRWA